MSNKILKLEFISMLLINLLSTFFLTYNNYIQHNDYLNILITTIFMIPLYYLFYLIFNYQDKLPLDKKINTIFHHKLAFIINILLTIIVLYITLSNFYMLIYYIKVLYLNKTPLFIIGIAFIIPLILVNLKGIKGIARLSFILLFINIITYLFLLFKLATFIKTSNIIPNNLDISISFKYILLNISNIFIFLIIPKNNIYNNQNINKYIFITLIISILIISFFLFMVIGILGIKLFNYFDYPIYTLLKRIYLFNFINRLENIIFLTCINNLFINISLSFYYINQVINKKNSKSFIYYLASLLVLALLLSKSIFKINNLILISLIYIILLLIIGVIIIIKKNNDKSLF